MEKLSVNNLLYACIEKFYKNRHQIFHDVGKPFSISRCVVCGVVLYIVLTLFCFAF